MTVTRITTRDFDIFRINPIADVLRSHSPWKVAAVAASGSIAVVVATNLFQGTFGALHDFHAIEDLKTVFGQAQYKIEPSFPLIRDFVSWILLTAVMMGLYILQRQAQLMSTCLSHLADNGAIVARVAIDSSAGGSPTLDAKQTFGLNIMTRLMFIDRAVEGHAVTDAFDSIVDQTNRFATKISKPLAIIGAIPVLVFGLTLARGAAQRFFVALLPRAEHDGGQREAAWLHRAYDGWWASVDTHIAGYITFSLCAIIGVAVVLSFQPVGTFVLYLIIGMRHTVDWSADWSNRDGRFGWQPVADVYRTVLQAVTLLGIGISAMIFLLGIDYVYILPLVALYVVVAPFFVVVPRIVWRDVARSAKQRRTQELLSPYKPAEVDNPHSNALLLATLQEVRRCQEADIKPIRVWKIWTSTSFTALIFPVILTVLQLAYPWLGPVPH